MELSSYIGKRVLVTTGPHAGRLGTADRLEYVAILGKDGLVINYDIGQSGFIFRASDLRLAPEKEVKR